MFPIILIKGGYILIKVLKIISIDQGCLMQWFANTPWQVICSCHRFDSDWRAFAHSQGWIRSFRGPKHIEDYDVTLIIKSADFCYLNSNRAFGLMSRMFTNGLGDQGSIPVWVIPKTQKMIIDAALLNTQHYKVRIKGKVEQSWGWSSTLPNTSV